MNFTEGQEVHQGDTLAVIDPRPLQAALTQAIARKAQDQAQLISAQKDLTRFSDLAKRDFATQQSVDQQQAKVDQLKAMIDADQGAIENAQTQLSYATITAPFDGRVGFRQVDAGNIIHPTDANPLTVLTQIKPSMVIFTLPQRNLGDVREAMLRGKVAVLAYRPGRRARAGAWRAPADRQPDRPDDQHDPPQGALPERRLAALAGRVRARARAGRGAGERRDDSAAGAAARPERALCLGDQAGQHRRAAHASRPRPSTPTP